VVQAGKIDFCHICSQRFTITAYTKHSPDGEGLLCHKCGAVEQNAPKKAAPRRKRTTIGKGTAKMLLEGKEDRIGKLQDTCIKVNGCVEGANIRLLRNIFMTLKHLAISVLSTWIRFARSSLEIDLSIMTLSRSFYSLILLSYGYTTAPVQP